MTVVRLGGAAHEEELLRALEADAPWPREMHAQALAFVLEHHPLLARLGARDCRTWAPVSVAVIVPGLNAAPGVLQRGGAPDAVIARLDELRQIHSEARGRKQRARRVAAARPAGRTMRSIAGYVAARATLTTTSQLLQAMLRRSSRHFAALDTTDLGDAEVRRLCVAACERGLLLPGDDDDSWRPLLPDDDSMLTIAQLMRRIVERAGGCMRTADLYDELQRMRQTTRNTIATTLHGGKAPGLRPFPHELVCLAELDPVEAAAQVSCVPMIQALKHSPRASRRGQRPGGPTRHPDARSAQRDRRGTVPRSSGGAAPTSDYQWWTAERVADAIREWASITGEPPYSGDWASTDRMLEALDAAGVAADSPARDHRRWPTTHMVVNLAGSWNRGMAAAGFTPRARGTGQRAGRKAVWTRERIIDAIQRWHATYGEVPTSRQWSRVSKHDDPGGLEHPTMTPVLREFGSFNVALVEAGLASEIRMNMRRLGWTRESVIEALRRWAERHGRVPKQVEWRQASAERLARMRAGTPLPCDAEPQPSASTVRRLFGTWKAAISAAGLMGS